MGLQSALPWHSFKSSSGCRIGQWPWKLEDMLDRMIQNYLSHLIEQTLEDSFPVHSECDGGRSKAENADGRDIHKNFYRQLLFGFRDPSRMSKFYATNVGVGKSA